MPAHEARDHATYDYAIIQTSPVHTGSCTDPEAVLEHLLDTMVRRPAV